MTKIEEGIDNTPKEFEEAMTLIKEISVDIYIYIHIYTGWPESQCQVGTG